MPSLINMAEKVLLTGGSGFIASHILRLLLENGYHVTVTVRSHELGERIVKSYPGYASGYLSYVVVEDISRKGAMNDAVVSDLPFTYVIHTASPFVLHFSDAAKDVLEPAINGTIGVLQAIKIHAPTVRRVVILSSFAAMINPRTATQGAVVDDKAWNPVTWDEAVADPRFTYAGSKTLAEKAAWDFMAVEKPSFDLVTLNPPLVFGPVTESVSLDRLNTSNQRIAAIVEGKLRDSPLPPTGVYLWLDVRDLALAHVRALAAAEAGGQRFLVAAGYFSNKAIVDTIRETHPELSSKLPENSVDDTPPNLYKYNDGKKAASILGMTSYRGFNETIGDTVDSLIEKIPG